MDIKTNEKIRVRLESFNHELLTSSCRKLIRLLTRTYDISTVWFHYQLINVFIVFYVLPT